MSDAGQADGVGQGTNPGMGQGAQHLAKLRAGAVLVTTALFDVLYSNYINRLVIK